MQEPWSRYLRLGIVHSMAYPAVMKGDRPYVETLRDAAATVVAGTKRVFRDAWAML